MYFLNSLLNPSMLLNSVVSTLHSSCFMYLLLLFCDFPVVFSKLFFKKIVSIFARKNESVTKHELGVGERKEQIPPEQTLWEQGA